MLKECIFIGFTGRLPRCRTEDIMYSYYIMANGGVGDEVDAWPSYNEVAMGTR